MKFLLIISGFFLSASLIYGQADNKPDFAVVRLSQIEYFAFGGTGEAGGISAGEKYYKEILKHPSAQKDFLFLLKISNPQAKCYALVGLRAVAPKKFAEIADEYSKVQTEVTIRRGCLVQHSPFSVILSQIKEGKYP